MASDKQMTLMLQIKAQANGLVRGFQEANSAVSKFSGGLSVIQTTGAATFRTLGAGASLFFAPLKIAAGAVAGLTTALVGLGGAAIHAAAGDEELIARLAAVYGSAEKARKVFAQLEALSAKGPFKSDDMAEAVLVLRQFGLASEKNLGALANASRVAGGSIADMANSVAMLQVRGLKKFGIGLEDQADGSFVISYRNQAGKIKTMAAKDGEEVRRKLLGVLGGKFGTDFKPKSFNDFISMLKNQLDQVFSNIGAPMLRSAQRFLEFLGKRLNSLLESGKLEEWGEKLAGWLERGANFLMDAFDTIPAVMEAFENAMKKGPDALKEIFGSIIKAMGNTLAVAIVEAVSATASIWVGIAKMFAGVLGEELLQLPGMGAIRAEKGINNANEAFAHGDAKAFQSADPTFLKNVRGRMAEGSSQGEAVTQWFDALSPQQQAKVAMGSGKSQADLMMEGINQAKNALPQAMSNIGATADAGLRDVNTTIKGVTGVDIGKAYRDAGAARIKRQAEEEEAARKAKEQADFQARYGNARVVTARFLKGYSTNGSEKQPIYQDLDMAAPEGRFTKGQRVRSRNGESGTVINIGSLNMTESRTETFKDDLMRMGLSPGAAAAAT